MNRVDQPSESGGPLFDEAFLARIRRLRLLTHRLRSGGLVGEHRSTRRGVAPEVTDFQRYVPGDDLRLVDWNVYARLGTLFIRLSEIETEVGVHLLLDASGSMNWGDPLKFDYARRIVAMLSYVGLWHFDRVTIVPFSDTLDRPFGPASGRSRTGSLLRYLEALRAGGRTDLGMTVDRYVHMQPRPGILVLVSDLLSDGLDRALYSAGERRWDVSVIHLLDEAEISPDLTGDHDLVDLETGERLRISPTREVLDTYRAAVNDWLAECERSCRASGATYVRVLTHWPLEDLALTMLTGRGVVR